MRIFLHVLFTWVLSNILNPVLLLIYFFIEEDGFDTGNEANLFLMSFYIMILAIPSLLMAWPALFLIMNSKYEGFEKMLLWILACITSIILNISGVMFLIFGEFVMEMLWLSLPASISLIIITLIRVNSFLALNIQSKTIQHENNLV